jgi:hypothetical protein
MEIWETLTMSRKEVPRAGLLEAALAGRITNAEGARALQLSVRQFRRLKRRFAAERAAGLRHRLRARRSPRRLAGPLRERVGQLLERRYADLNDCQATEKLREIEGLALSRSSVRRLHRCTFAPRRTCTATPPCSPTSARSTACP